MGSLQRFLGQAVPSLGVREVPGAIGARLEGYLGRSDMPDLVAAEQFGEHS